jgi:hypothetical protein
MRTFTSTIWRALALSGALLALAGPAHADDGDDKRAEALFREGREALARGDNATACAKFAESVRLTQSPGPLLNVALCAEQSGDLVTALARWRAGLAMLPPDDERAAVARAHVEALDRRVPRLSIKLPPDVPLAAVVKLDGAPIDSKSLGAPRPVGVGSHEVVVEATGRPPWSARVTLAEGDRREVAPLPPAAAERGGSRRTAGFVVGGVGVASLLVGAITGGLAFAKKGVVVDNCVGGCNQAARDARDSGKAIAHASTATFVIGGAALAAGLILVVTDRPKGNVSVSAAPLPGGGAISLAGAF